MAPVSSMPTTENIRHQPMTMAPVSSALKTLGKTTPSVTTSSVDMCSIPSDVNTFNSDDDTPRLSLVKHLPRTRTEEQLDPGNNFSKKRESVSAHLRSLPADTPKETIIT